MCKGSQAGEAVIVGACRTAIGSFGGALAGVPAATLGGAALAEAVRRAGVDTASVSEVIMGQVLQAGQGQHPARQAGLAAGLPLETTACSVNKMCGSGLQAVCQAARAVRAGDAEIVAAGGMESMSRAPYLLDQARSGYRIGHGSLVDSMIRDGLWDVYNDCHMAVAVETLAKRYGIGRREQDEFAARSQARCAEAQRGGRFDEEVVPFAIPQRKGAPVDFRKDEFPKPATTVEILAGLKPAFSADGTVTAGNASGISDGAAAVVVMSESRAKALGRKPLARIRGYATVGVEPILMGIGPVGAAQTAVERAGLSMGDIGLFELNEAFAAQSLAVLRELKCDIDRVNVNGGAIALGHPIGASGARILVTLLYEMRRRGVRYGLAALCIGGGEGIAMVVEGEG